MEVGKRNFVYHFIGQGSIVNIDEEKKRFYVQEHPKQPKRKYDIDRTIFLDVGNRLCEGVIDHHHLLSKVEKNGRGYGSATGILSAFPNYINNIHPSISTIHIVVHSLPDFDCFAATYLAQYYLENRKFPFHCQQIVDYVELIDSGKMGTKSDQLITPYTITLVIGEVTKQLLYENNDTYRNYVDAGTPWLGSNMLNEAMMNRGLELMGYISETLQLLRESGHSLTSPSILTERHPFMAEEDAAKVDYEKYQADIENDCEIRKMTIPSKKDQESIVEVDGLFWNRIPRCSLHKLWARSDGDSPSGKGYAFTFIPSRKNKLVEGKYEINSVIISVDPHCNVQLYHLGKALELAELKKEEDIFQDNVHEWRTREVKRYEDEWCTNGDPWYDGRSHDFTIIDSPRVGSLLSIEEIKDITIKWSENK